MLSTRLIFVSMLTIFTIGCGDGGSPSPTAPTPAPSPAPGGPSSSITIPVGAELLGNRAFVPGELDIAVGTTVTWRNADTITHTSTSDAAGWQSGNIAPGGDFSRLFETAGRFPYHCSIHPGMVGTVVVR